jgi:hypothetical protein
VKVIPLSITFYGISSGEDFISQVFRGVGLRFGIVYRRGFFGLSQVVATFITKIKACRRFCTTIGANHLQ